MTNSWNRPVTSTIAGTSSVELFGTLAVAMPPPCPGSSAGGLPLLGQLAWKDDVRALIRELNREIAALYPGLPINRIDAIEFERAGGYFVIAKEAGEAVGCGAIRPVDERCAEIKRAVRGSPDPALRRP